jgi:valyl-tRNA synthetase
MDRPTPPEKPTVDGIEPTWAQVWEEQGTYRFDRSKGRAEIYAIDTPPPTVSGSLHVGHVFSYTHTDVVARYQRMRGREVFYPMGWDDNGLPTERRVQNYYGVRCDPSLPYDPAFEPPAEPAKHPLPISRQNFVELCNRLTVEDERAFEAVWRRLGLSVDWSMTYATIDDNARAVAQRAFLRDLARGDAYQAEAPTLWDITYRTAVAQAELEDREQDSAYHRLAFHRADGGVVEIDTTRPELVPACVALVAHPDDARYRELVGSMVRTPVFGVEVPVVAHHLADPEKGTGIAMICTFGDTTDVTWWRELQLPTRAIIGRDGRIVADPPPGLDDEGGRAAYARLAGSTVHTAQQTVLELLAGSGDLRGDPRPIRHPVKFYERGERPLEIVTSRQWYIRNGGRDEDLRAQLVGRGRNIRWHPSYMRARYENWVEGLNGDWLVSRQRFFGVPFPVWYRLDDEGNPRYDQPLLADEAALPVDPSSDPAPGHDESQRGVPGGFTADPDVMDTWATSSLSPQIAGGWGHDEDLFARVFPMDLRPQGHDIIRTWLFSTVVRSNAEFGTVPWSNAALSGWILDPDRKKMSKSKGNVVTPWACSSSTARTRCGTGPRAAARSRRCVRGRPDAHRPPAGHQGAQREPVRPRPRRRPGVGRRAHRALDRALLAELATVVQRATRGARRVRVQPALEATETFFWTFCDDYVELVKERAYGGRGPQAATSAAGDPRGGARGPPTAVRAGAAVRHRGGLVLVAGRLGPPGRVAGRRRGPCTGGRRRRRPAPRRLRRPHPGAQGEVRGEGLDAGRGRPGRRRGSGRRARPAGRCGRRPARRRPDRIRGDPARLRGALVDVELAEVAPAS